MNASRREGCALSSSDQMCLWGENSSICYFHTNLFVLKLLLHSLSVSSVCLQSRNERKKALHCYSNVLEVVHEGLTECLVVGCCDSAPFCFCSFDVILETENSIEKVRRKKGRIIRCNRLTKLVISIFSSPLLSLVKGRGHRFPHRSISCHLLSLHHHY